jgi:hypothetical protein
MRRELDRGPQARDAAADNEEISGDASRHGGLLS